MELKQQIDNYLKEYENLISYKLTVVDGRLLIEITLYDNNFDELYLLHLFKGTHFCRETYTIVEVITSEDDFLWTLILDALDELKEKLN